MKRRILFVDDEPQVLEGLRHRLHRQRARWELRFVQSGPEALELLAREAVDVIVSDMRMPQMDGAALLRRVQEEHPRVVRIVLSGHAELETALRAVPVAHQFLTKPSEAGVIEEVIERACALQAVIGDESVRRVVGRIERLPSLPRVYQQLVAALARESVQAEELARVVEQDMAICAKTLQIVNSAFFRLSRSISRIEEAVRYLGFNALKQIVLAVEIFEDHAVRGLPALELEALQAHALAVGRLAAALVERPQREDGFVAGLLHDLGRLVLLAELPDQCQAALVRAAAERCPLQVAEAEVLGTTHAEVGGYLLGLWGLPYPIIEAVASHHAPARVACAALGLVGAVHVADALVHETRPGATVGAGPDAIDLGYLAAVGATAELAGWRELAREQLGAAER